MVKSATSNSYWLLKRQRETERDRERRRARKQLSAEVEQEQIPSLWGGRTKKSYRHTGSQEELLLCVKRRACALQRGRKIMGKNRGSTSQGRKRAALAHLPLAVRVLYGTLDVL